MRACRANLARLLGFTLCVALVGALLSVIAKVWVDLSWWRVFRRCASIAAALSLVFFLWRIHHQSIRSLGLGPWQPVGKRHFLRGMWLGCATVAVILGIYLLTGACRIRIHPDTARVWRTLIAFVPAAVLVGLLEELVFRGYVLRQLLACSTWVAVVGSSAAYAVVHLRAIPLWPQSAFELMGLFILGVTLALGTLRTQQLYLAIGMHASLAYWARVNKLLVTFPDPAWEWLVGTNRLANGVLAWVVLLGLGWVVSRTRRVA